MDGVVLQRPGDLRIENPARFWTIVFPRRVAPVLVVLLAIELVLSFVFLFDSADPLGVLAFVVRCVVIVGLAIVARGAWRGSQAEAVEFSDRFRFYERGSPIAFDWNQIATMWYEGVRNPARVKMTATKPSTTEDRVLIVGLRGGAEVRIRAAPDSQPHVLEWARFVERAASERVAS